MKELKWAVVGKMRPLMKFSCRSSCRFYFWKKEEAVDRVWRMLMMSGSPSSARELERRCRRPTLIESD
jgi:hypothetical protein